MLLNCGVGEDSWESLGLQGDPKGDQAWAFIGRTNVEADCNILATWCEELTHLKRPWCWERLKAGGEGDNKGWDGWIALPTPWAYSNSCPSSWWCHPTISSSVIPFSSCLQSFPASGSFQMSQFFISGGQSIGVLALALVLPLNIQGWFPLELTGLISLQSEGLSTVFSNTTVQKHQFFGVQLSL